MPRWGCTTPVRRRRPCRRSRSSPRSPSPSSPGVPRRRRTSRRTPSSTSRSRAPTPTHARAGHGAEAGHRGGHGAAPAATAAPLNDDLFSDLDLPGNRGDGGQDEDDGQHEDPLAQLGGGDGDERQPVEDTRHFAAKSGVTRRNPAWKYAVFVLLLLVVPLGGAYLLSETLGVVPLRVKTVDAEGNAVEQPVFSSKGVGALRDKLLGRSSPAPAPK
ncbi:hypothetical protein ACLESO_50045, partial [Pyxidicoccus sp. 3LG]